MDLLETMKGALAETFAFYFKAHTFHWNVQGPLFAQFHDLFGKIYADAWGAVDDIAEHIRAIDEMAPNSPQEILSGCKITFPGAGSNGLKMVEQLLADNGTVTTALEEAQAAAEDDGNVGLANFLQDRLDRHAKWGWMLRSTTKKKERSPLHDHPRSMKGG